MTLEVGGKMRELRERDDVSEISMVARESSSIRMCCTEPMSAVAMSAVAMSEAA